MIPLILSALFGAVVTAVTYEHLHKREVRELYDATRQSIKRALDTAQFINETREQASYDRGYRDGAERSNAMTFNPPRRHLTIALAVQQPEPEETGIGSRI